MLIAVDTNVVRDYTLERDRGENPTVFELGVMDGVLGPYLIDKYSQVSQTKGESQVVTMKGGSYMLDVVRFGLKGWRNFVDKEGKPVPFKRSQMNIPNIGNRWVVDEQCLRALEAEWITELANEIHGDNTVSEADAKNSKPPSEN